MGRTWDEGLGLGAGEMGSPVLEFEERLVEDLRKVPSCFWSGHLIYQAVREGIERGDARLRPSAPRGYRMGGGQGPRVRFLGQGKGSGVGKETGEEPLAPGPEEARPPRALPLRIAVQASSGSQRWAPCPGGDPPWSPWTELRSARSNRYPGAGLCPED